ncbi:hypothetical protein N9L92_05355 [Saprospiraceae bacterium]|nr:hypothetical protein [Saprospiraceae bacterium]
MNLIKVILLLFLVLKSSGGFTMPMMSCCESPAEPTELTNNCDDEEDKDDCCGGSNCECLCCSHVFTLEDFCELSILPTSYSNIINAAYIDRLSRIYSNALWQPPQNS